MKTELGACAKGKKKTYHLLYTLVIYRSYALANSSQRSLECQKVKAIFKELPPNMERLALDTNNMVT